MSLTLRFNCGLLWIRSWTLRFIKCREFLDALSNWRLFKNNERRRQINPNVTCQCRFNRSLFWLLQRKTDNWHVSFKSFMSAAAWWPGVSTYTESEPLVTPPSGHIPTHCLSCFQESRDRNQLQNFKVQKFNGTLKVVHVSLHYCHWRHTAPYHIFHLLKHT